MVLFWPWHGPESLQQAAPLLVLSCQVVPWPHPAHIWLTAMAAISEVLGWSGWRLALGCSLAAISVRSEPVYAMCSAPPPPPLHTRNPAGACTCGGVLYSEDAWVDPAAATQALLARAQALGARVLLGTRVLQLVLEQQQQQDVFSVGSAAAAAGGQHDKQARLGKQAQRVAGRGGSWHPP